MLFNLNLHDVAIRRRPVVHSPQFVSVYQHLFPSLNSLPYIHTYPHDGAHNPLETVYSCT